MEHVYRTAKAIKAIARHFFEDFDECWTPDEKFMLWTILHGEGQMEYFESKGMLRIPDRTPEDLGPLDDVKVAEEEDEEDE